MTSKMKGSSALKQKWGEWVDICSEKMSELFTAPDKLAYSFNL